MAFTAKLSIPGIDFDELDGAVDNTQLIDFSYSLNRDYDAKSQPSGELRGGIVNLTFESRKSASFFEWIAASAGETKDEAKISIAQNDNAEASARDIIMKKVRIIDYSESYHWQGNENLLTTITLTCQELEINGSSHMNRWTA